MDLDNARLRQRRSYTLSGIGFALLTVWLLSSSFYTGSFVVLAFTGHQPALGHWLGIDFFEFYYNTARVWARGLGFLLLWAAWPERTWKRRSGLLVVMSLADMGIWAAQYGVELGILERPAGHEFLRLSLSMALGWARFILVAGLAANFAEHLGRVKAGDLGKAASTTATTGGMLWFFFFLNEINWNHRGPLVPRGWTPELIMLLLSTQVVMTICTIQLTLLSFMATRSASEALRAMLQEDRRFEDPWALEQAEARADDNWEGPDLDSGIPRDDIGC